MRLEPTEPVAVMCATATAEIRERFLIARAHAREWEPRPCPPDWRAR